MSLSDRSLSFTRAVRLACLIAAVLTLVFLSYMPASAWNVEIVHPDASKLSMVKVGNTLTLYQVDIYLVRADLDAQQGQDPPPYLSWTIDEGWKPGIHPAFDMSMDLKPFDPLDVTSIPSNYTDCPAGHRCLLDLVAVTAGEDPFSTTNWQATSVLPLSRQAAQERLPGQAFFLASEFDSGAFFHGGRPNGLLSAPEVDFSAQDSESVTEKPDLFKVQGDLLLYANGQAKRFQVVDISDPAVPRLVDSISLTGSPKEIYALDECCYLLQSGERGKDEETYMSVLKLDHDSKITTVQELSIPGTFVESRRRARTIYTVGSSYDFPYNPFYYEAPTCEVTVNAIDISEDGRVSVVDEQKISGSNPVISIFPDHLVCATTQGWWSNNKSLINIFDLADTEGPLTALPGIDIPGRIPSEFHMDVQNQELRLVYGPEDSTHGSTLAIFDLGGQDSPSLVGSLEGIAPGEDLFATRFAGDVAYVVTYERIDPLWVLDLSNSAMPKVLGELEVPGWSEKLFFNDDRLFAMGIDDQPTTENDSGWVRRVAASLFDVSDPTDPVLVRRFVPLEGETAYTDSEALQDERALLLDWEDEFAVFPLEAWSMETNNHLQFLSLQNNDLKDAGRLLTPVPIRRSVPVGSGLLAVMGDQELFTVEYGKGNPRVLGRLELAANIMWLEKTESELWAASSGRNGLYRLYNYDPSDLESPVNSWGLSSGYDGALLQGTKAVFYDLYPLAIRIIDVDSGTVSAAETLDPEDSRMASRSMPILFQDRFYVAEHRMEPEPKPEPEPGEDVWSFAPCGEQWVLRSWRLEDTGAVEEPERSIPGQPVAITEQGDLLCREVSSERLLRLDLLTLTKDQARLLHSQEFQCDAWSSTVILDENSLYVACVPPTDWDRIQPLDMDEYNTVPYKEPVNKTTVLCLDPSSEFEKLGSWEFEGVRNIQAAHGNLVLLGPNWYFPMPCHDISTVSGETDYIIPQQEKCGVYRLTQDGSELLVELDDCWNPDGIALSGQGVYVAEGYEGIREFTW